MSEYNTGYAHFSKAMSVLAITGVVVATKLIYDRCGKAVPEPSPVDSVKETTAYVMRHSQCVTISGPAVTALANKLRIEDLTDIQANPFDREVHLVDGTWKTVQYLLVIDALNFCFWPVQGLEYEHLARGLKDHIAAVGISAISANNLAKTTPVEIRQFFGTTRQVPLEEERARLLREVGTVLLANFGGRASNLVRASRGSAVALVRLITQHFPGFRDNAVYRGRQVFLYKRAQIFVADVYGAFGGRGLGSFRDIDQLTMFADYRVPVVLRKYHVLEYSEALQAQIKGGEELEPGCMQEIEIRAATIQAVERLREAIAAKHGGAVCPTAVQLDWWLWEQGEQTRSTDGAHHRTLTTNY